MTRISQPIRFRLVGAVVVALFAHPTISAEKKISFNDQIRPLFSNHCFFCHGPDEEEQKAGLRLDTFEGATADNDGVRAIVPGDPKASEAFYRITTDDEDEVMPPPKHGKPFNKDEAALIKKWIEQGAEYETHWSYVAPKRPAVPALADSAPAPWKKHPVDAFLHRGLVGEKWTPSPATDRRTLARRVSLDLTGLPPTPEEVSAFLKDDQPGAYERFVDRLLAKPGYGEHWARMWLDLARYADSAGYADDPARTIWAYRDYVIRAFNENRPFDQFTIEQIAGDLLENPTEEQLVATAFHRNTQTNSEGGTNDEEFRNVAVVDRVNTTMATWMGTTMACAQCHTHKYDPITHEEYFQVFDIFNQTEDADRRREEPIMSVLTEADLTKKADLEKRVTTLEQKHKQLGPELEKGLAAWEAKRKNAPEVKWTPLTVTKATAKSGATFENLDDGSLRVGGKKAETDTYTLEAETGLKTITALRIEPLADESLNAHKGPGREGNFVLNEVTAFAKADGPTKRGRFVRLELPGANKWLHLREVEVYSNGKNVARQGKASQSSTGFDGPPERGIDGNTKDGYTHTATGDKAPHWEVDLGKELDLERVVLFNRADGNVQDRLAGLIVKVLDTDRQPVWTKTYAKAFQDKAETSLDGSTPLTFVAASSTYDQPKFDVAKAIDGDPTGNSGWAVGGALGQNHAAVLKLAKPITAKKLQILLEQSYGKHALGRFRILATDAKGDVSILPNHVETILAKASADRSAPEKKQLLEFYAPRDPAGKKLTAQLTKARKDLTAFKPTTTVPVMRQLATDKQRKTHIHLRGSYLSHGDEVSAALPSAFHPLPDGSKADRLGLAKWLIDEKNPLTGRVVANRFWEKIFGIGIVATSEEFGSQGEAPSHPELLDWLAVEFMESGWDTKAFLKLLVTSAAYQQSSHVTDEMAERDPANRYLARGPRIRLSAEMVRDQALSVAGLLSPKMYGAPVKPPQPDMGLKAAFGATMDWKTSEGEDRYRRGLYTTWRRSNPYPSMVAFDAPNREVCTVRRDRTNTPLQALVTLNDPVYIEAAQGLARRMIKAGATPAEQINAGFELCLSRQPTGTERDRLLKLRESILIRYRADNSLATKMATDPLGPAPEGVEVTELASLTVIANVLLNLDEILMKR